MNNVIRFPAIGEREASVFEREMNKCWDPQTKEAALADIIKLAVNAKTAEVRERAKRWMLEIMNVRITSQ